MVTDKLQRFLFSDSPVRGEYVRLHDVWREVLARRAYPPVLQKYLGELLAAAAMMSAMLKFDGKLIMQLHGNGHIRLVVVECSSDLSLRATAQWNQAETIPDLPLATLLGEGHFVITLAPHDKDSAPYQGIVELTGDNVAHLIEHYMSQSEQLDTRIWLASSENDVAGLMLQKLPSVANDRKNGQVQDTQEQWQRLTALASTVSIAELLELAPQKLLYRLFHQESVNLLPEAQPHFTCTCSRNKVTEMLNMLDRDETALLLAEHGYIEVNCDFCGLCYRFDKLPQQSGNDTRI